MKTKWTKKAAVEAMSLYLDHLSRQRPLGEKRAAACRINQLIDELEETGSLPGALGAVYPEKTAEERRDLAQKLAAGAYRFALGRSQHPSQELTGEQQIGGQRISKPTTKLVKKPVERAPATNIVA